MTSVAMQTKLEFLHPYYNYTCAVAAVTTEVGPYSIPITVTTNEDGEISYFSYNYILQFCYAQVHVPLQFPLVHQKTFKHNPKLQLQLYLHLIFHHKLAKTGLSLATSST